MDTYLFGVSITNHSTVLAEFLPGLGVELETVGMGGYIGEKARGWWMNLLPID